MRLVDSGWVFELHFFAISLSSHAAHAVLRLGEFLYVFLLPWRN